jgi:parallel beta-helix repeat protein
MQKTSVSYKTLVIGVIVLFICMNITTSIAIDTVKESFGPISNGNTLYVGGTGEGNYTKIQDAINDANHDDTVYVYNDSSPYYETSIRVHKSINIIGEDKDTTIIDGGGYDTVISFYADNITFTGFTVQNGGEDYFAFDSGIKVGNSSNVIITGNIISNNRYIGLFVYAHKCLVSQNTITSNNIGILVFPDPKGEVMIFNNTVDSNCVGIDIAALNTSVFRNEIRANIRSIRITESINISIFENNFRKNEKPPIFVQLDRIAVKWNNNYWNRPRFLPKLIIGKRYLAEGNAIFWINIDWHPTLKPNEVSSG